MSFSVTIKIHHRLLRYLVSKYLYSVHCNTVFKRKPSLSRPSPLITGLTTVNVRARSYEWQTCWKQSEPKICKLLQPRLQPLAANCRIPVCLWQHEPFGFLPQVQHRLTRKRVYSKQGKLDGLTEILLTYCDWLFVFSRIWSPYIADNTIISNLHPQTIPSAI